MNKYLLRLAVFSTMALGACSVQLASVINKTTEQISTAYHVTKDIAYGPDKEQTLDLYLSTAAQQLKNKNYTIVFLHGGGYYLRDKAREERYI